MKKNNAPIIDKLLQFAAATSKKRIQQRTAPLTTLPMMTCRLYL